MQQRNPEQHRQSAHYHAHNRRQQQACAHGFSDAAVFSRADIGADKADGRLVEGVHRHIDKAFDVCRRRIARYHNCAVAVDGGLDQNVGNGEACALEARRQADFQHAAQLFHIDVQPAEIQMHKAMGTDQADNDQQRRYRLGNDGRPRNAAHSHVKFDYEYQVQRHID